MRCWGLGASGQLGYGSTANVGNTPTTTPDKVGPVPLGGLKAVAISAGGSHTCAILAGGSVRCWGLGASGQLGYGTTSNVGDAPATTPAMVGPVDLGSGRTAVAISAGQDHTCARLDDGHVRCWGSGAAGRLGYCNTTTVGDDEPPAAAGPVNLQPGDGGVGCPPAPPGPAPTTAPGGAADAGPGLSMPALPPPALPPPAPDGTAAASAAQHARAAALRTCLRRVSRQARRRRHRARQLPATARAIAMRRIEHRARRARDRCLRRYGRTPGRVSVPDARATGVHAITLTFGAAGTDHSLPPAARSYVIKQSTRPIRTSRDFRVAHSLCAGNCAFDVTRVGATIVQTVTDLQGRRVYYYAIAARDNVSRRLGPRSPTVSARTR